MPKTGFYATGPVVPAKKIADKSPFPTPKVGAGAPSVVPQTQGQSSGFAGTTAHRFKPPTAVRAHTFGHKVKQHQGALRVSGVPKGHRLGIPGVKS